MHLSDLIDSVVQQAATENFAELTTLTGTATRARCDYIATIGFAGKSIRGVLTWGCNRDVAVGLCAMGEIPVDVVRDWAGEMANQLLGRVKNKLLAHEIEISLGTPLVIAGSELEVSPPRNSRCSGAVDTAFGQLRVILDYAAEPNIMFRAEPHRVAAQEGDTFLF